MVSLRLYIYAESRIASNTLLKSYIQQRERESKSFSTAPRGERLSLCIGKNLQFSLYILFPLVPRLNAYTFSFCVCKL